MIKYKRLGGFFMKTFIFDVDDTLYDQVQPFEKAFNKYLKGKYDLDVQELYKRSRVYSDAIFPQVESGEMSVDDSGVYRMIHALKEYGITYTPEEALVFQLEYRYQQSHLELSQTIIDMFDDIKERVQLGVLTNGVSEHQHKKIEGLKLKRWIPESHCFVSGDLGVSKPDIKAFKHIEKQLHNKPIDTYFVGDSLNHDLIGAKQAGWKMIWINRRNHDVSKCLYQPDYIVKNEEEMISTIKKIINE